LKNDRSIPAEFPRSWIILEKKLSWKVTEKLISREGDREEWVERVHIYRYMVGLRLGLARDSEINK